MDPQCLDHHNPPSWRNRNGGVKTAAWRTFRRRSASCGEQRVTVQGPVKKSQMDYLSHRGSLLPFQCIARGGGPIESPQSGRWVVTTPKHLCVGGEEPPTPPDPQSVCGALRLFECQCPSVRVRCGCGVRPFGLWVVSVGVCVNFSFGGGFACACGTGGGGGYFGRGKVRGGVLVFRLVPKFPPSNVFLFLLKGHFLLPRSAANNFLLSGGSGARALAVSLYASAYPKTFFSRVSQEMILCTQCVS